MTPAVAPLASRASRRRRKNAISFAPSVNYAAGQGAYAVTATDLNGDGKLDLAIAHTNSGYVVVRLNQGNGTFADVSFSHAAGSKPAHVVAADLNGDRRLDLAVANPDEVDVLLNTCLP